MTSKIKHFPGTALSESDFDEGKILFNYDKLHAEYAWDTGVAIGAYLAGLKRGVILGSYCPTCRKTVVPPRTVCEQCYHPMDEYLPLLDSGTVQTFSLCYVTWDVQRIQEPEIPAVIAIDGASPGYGILHLLGDVKPDKVRIGMRVKAVWRLDDERTGSITDILYFMPVEV